MKYVFINVETTGLPASENYDVDIDDEFDGPLITLLSYISISFNEDRGVSFITGMDNTVVKMKDGIHIYNSYIHGITDEISAERGIPIRRALGGIMRAIQEADVVVAHSAQHVLNTIRSEIVRLATEPGGAVTRSMDREYQEHLKTLDSKARAKRH